MSDALSLPAVSMPNLSRGVISVLIPRPVVCHLGLIFRSVFPFLSCHFSANGQFFCHSLPWQKILRQSLFAKSQAFLHSSVLPGGRD